MWDTTRSYKASEINLISLFPGAGATTGRHTTGALPHLAAQKVAEPAKDEMKGAVNVEKVDLCYARVASGEDDRNGPREGDRVHLQPRLRGHPERQGSQLQNKSVQREETREEQPNFVNVALPIRHCAARTEHLVYKEGDRDGIEANVRHHKVEKFLIDVVQLSLGILRHDSEELLQAIVNLLLIS